MSVSGSQSNESPSGIREQAGEMAGRVMDQVKEKASQMTDVVERSGVLGEATSSEGGIPVVEKATEQVTSRLDIGREYVAETMSGVADALRQTGRHLREDSSQYSLAQYADRGADEIESIGGYLRGHDTEQIVSELEGFARRQPLVFAGGAFALGMLAVRFFRSESQPARPTPTVGAPPTYGAASYGGASATASPTSGRSVPGSAAGTTPGSTGTPPGASTGSGSGHAAPNPTPTTRPTSPGAGGSGTAAGSGTQPTPGTRTGTPSAQPGQTSVASPTPPPVGGAPADSRTTTRMPSPRPQQGGTAPTSELSGEGY